MLKIRQTITNNFITWNFKGPDTQKKFVKSSLLSRWNEKDLCLKDNF